MESENSKIRYMKPHQSHFSNTLRPTRRGYEPSDVEMDWEDSPQHDQSRKNEVPDHDDTPNNLDSQRKISVVRQSRRHHPSRLDDSALVKDFVANPATRRLSINPPYMARRDSIGAISSLSSHSDIVYMLKSELEVEVSPAKSDKKEHEKHENVPIVCLSRKTETPRREERASERPSSRRPKTAPRSRASENKDQDDSHGSKERKAARTPTSKDTRQQRGTENPHQSRSISSSAGQLNEMISNIKISKTPTQSEADIYQKTDSISPSDIFFSSDHTGLPESGLKKTDNNGTSLFPRPLSALESKAASDTLHNSQRTMSYRSVSQTSVPSSFSVSGQMSDKLSRTSSKISDWSGRTTGRVKRFVENRKKSQTETWFSCMRGGRCKTSKSPERQYFDEATYIEKANVVESLRPFWADKYQPRSLIGFTCHKRETQVLKQLVLNDSVPHILFKGPSGSGKRALTVALLGEIFGDACWKVSHDLRYFTFQHEKRPMQIVVPVTSSAHHAELNVSKEPNVKYALMGLMREISNEFAITPETSIVNFEPEYKVLVLYDLDKAEANIQHMIKWVMDCYTDASKLVLCCEDDANILESVRNRCKVIDVDAPATHEIIEVLIQIARKENFELPRSFANKIAIKSKQNLRVAVMALEASKAHSYPFADDQPIQFGWEALTEEIAGEILADPSHTRLFIARGKLQKLLIDFVHPKLILLKLVEQFLKRVEASSRRQVYYWHAYYDKRLPTGTNALLKLEEFLAKFMSIHRRSSGNTQFV